MVGCCRFRVVDRFTLGARLSRNTDGGVECDNLWLCCHRHFRVGNFFRSIGARSIEIAFYLTGEDAWSLKTPTFTTIILINALPGGVTQDGVVENDTEPNKLLSDIEEHFLASHCLIWSRISEFPTPRDITPTNERKPEISSI